MSITTLSFLLLMAGTLVLYFALPKKCQWVVLLAASFVFYAIGGIQYLAFVVITATSIYFAGRVMGRISEKQKEALKEIPKEEKKEFKLKNKRKRKAVMLAALLLNIGILCYFKYIHFFLEQVNALLSLFKAQPINDVFSLLVPLGISFYTFQAVGYLADVYWGYYKPEKNYFKFLLFVSFFPQMTQGPISDFEQLSKELFTEHKLDYKNFSWGCQRMIWGFFKKLCVANVLSPWVTDAFANYQNYTGISTLIAAFMYSIQIYADFSGYMDIICGLCEVMGINLAENFDRPYFSRSVAEYWRKWHMTMGAWFKKYIYFPIAMSNSSRKLAKKTAKLGRHFSTTFPATLALLVTWMATGLWHGASWAYIVWGLVNGLFLILELWLKPFYAKSKSTLKINEEGKPWIAFQMVRTFILVTFIKVIPEVGTLKDGLGFLANIFTNHSIPHSISQLVPFVFTDLRIVNIATLFFGVCAMIVISVVQYKNSFRYYFNKLPKALRILILSTFIMVLITYGVQNTWGAGGFLYANF